MVFDGFDLKLRCEISPLFSRTGLLEISNPSMMCTPFGTKSDKEALVLRCTSVKMDVIDMASCVEAPAAEDVLIQCVRPRGGAGDSASGAACGGKAQVETGLHLIVNVPRGRTVDVRQELAQLVQASIDWLNRQAVAPPSAGSGALVPFVRKGHPAVIRKLKDAIVFVHLKSLEAGVSDADRSLALVQRGYLAGLLLRVWQEPVVDEARICAVAEAVLREECL